MNIITVMITTPLPVSPVQVCKHWRSVGEAPGLWTWSILRVSNANLADITYMLGRRRMLGIKRMEVKIRFYDSNPLDMRHSCGKSGGKLEILLKAMAKHPNLREVDFNETDFKSVHSHLLVKTLMKVEDARNLDSAQMTSQQLTDLLTRMGRGSRLKRLNLFGKNLSSLNPVLLAQALTQLEELESCWMNLRPQQWEAIFALLATSSSKLKKVDIFDNLRLVDAQLLATGLNNLEDVNIYFTKVTVAQVKALLMETRKGTKLKKLSLERIQLSSLKPSLIVEAVQQLEEVNLNTTSLTAHQIERIAVGISSSRLKKLSISSNSLFSVDLDLLARGVMELEEVEMVNMGLTAEQAFVLVGAVAASCKLRRVNLELNDLSSVDPTLLAKAVGKLEDINLGSTCLTYRQLVEICSNLQDGTKVKKISLWRNNISNVDKKLLAGALLQVSEVDLTATRLTEQQAMALFASLQTPKKLMKLKIAWNPSLWRIRNTGVMAKGLNKLDCVEMFGGVDEQGDSSLPSIGHVTSILKQSLVSTQLRKINIGKVRGGEVDEDLVKRAREVIDKVILF